jgi:hypothetical protein
LTFTGKAGMDREQRERLSAALEFCGVGPVTHPDGAVACVVAVNHSERFECGRSVACREPSPDRTNGLRLSFYGCFVIMVFLHADIRCKHFPHVVWQAESPSRNWWAVMFRFSERVYPWSWASHGDVLPGLSYRRSGPVGNSENLEILQTTFRNWCLC